MTTQTETRRQRKTRLERERYWRNRDAVLKNKYAWRDANKDKMRVLWARASRKQLATGKRAAISRRHREKHPERVIWRNCRCRAAKMGLAFDLTPDWIKARLDSGVCEATGLRFDADKGDKTRSPRTPSLDRIDSSGGYTQDNCQLVIWQFNAAKSEYGLEDLLVMATALVDKHGLVHPT